MTSLERIAQVRDKLSYPDLQCSDGGGDVVRAQIATNELPHFGPPLGQACGRPMITQLIFDWAKRTPDRTAIIYNNRPWSYQSFAQLIALARGYFARRGYVGPGYAVLAVYNPMDFWILSLALRSLGLTTVAVGSVTEGDAQGKPNVRAAVNKLGLPNVRCVITNPVETWAGLDGLCTELGLPLLSVSLAGETAMGLKRSKRRTLWAVISC